ncbi:MAG: H4MPT-linked C1 transfer pathway protein [Crenarchaeota archaeon]|nr:H4MPT-linked C1 transfer pathway protein [Thermoproteota archaeon]
MITILGYDIGGANIKAASITVSTGKILEIKTASKYFPFWKQDLKDFRKNLILLKNQLIGVNQIDLVLVTMTAELSDAFQTKRDGVTIILDNITQVFNNIPIKVLDAESNLISIDQAKQLPLKVASANWVATGWMISQYVDNCVIVDSGSTSTSIIPVIDGKIAAKGKTDLEKLSLGELVYTGSLRTNIAAIVQKIPLRGNIVRVSSELFCQSGDIHLILHNITKEQYTSDTADNRGKNRIDALSRLARLICADIEMLKEQELISIARYVYSKQIEQIAEGINQVYDKLGANSKEKIPVIVTGLGREFLSRKGANHAAIKRIINIEELLPKDVALISPAIGLAMMGTKQHEGKVLH